MSFKRDVFGSGFSLESIRNRASKRFDHLTEIHGASIALIHRTKTGYDDYGNPIFTELEYSIKAILEKQPKEIVLGTGEQVREALIAYVKTNAPILETDELSVDGLRYHIEAIEKVDAYLRIIAARRIDN